MLRGAKPGEKIASPPDTTDPMMPSLPTPEEITKYIAAIQTKIDTFCVATPNTIGDPIADIGGSIAPTNSTTTITPTKQMTMLKSILN